MEIRKKILSVFLSVLIMLSICSVATPVFAAEYDEYQETAQYTDSSSYGAQALSLDIFVPVIDSITGNPTSWTKGPVTLTVNATDYGSAGLAAKAYSFDGGNTWQASKSKTFNGNGTISIKVRDAAGNKSITKTVEITKIDTTAPTVSYKSGNPTSWTNKDVEIEVYGFDADSGIAAYYFNDVSYGLGTKKVCSQNQELKVKAKDHVGNYSNELSIYITKIDKSTPQVIAVSGNAAEWTNQDVTLNVDEYLCGDSGLEAYFFNGIKSMQSSKTFDSNKTVRVAVTNNAGTMSKSVDVVIDKIDKNNPTISGITVNENMQNPTQPSTVTVTASDNLSGVSQYSFDGGETWQEENTKEYFESCDNINIVVKDRAGNETSYSETISVNVTRPENYAPASPVIYSENNEVYILAGKTESPLVNSEATAFEYKVGENGTWKQCDGYLNIVNTYDVPVYARAVDKDGNYSEASSCIVKSNLGEYTASHNDIAYGEGVFPVPFERTYSSTNGWVFSFDANVQPITNGYVFTDFSGEKHYFVLNEEGKYVSADGDELELNENDYAYKVPYGELTCYFGNDGKLAFVKGSYISATYIWSANNLYIEDQAGNTTTLRISNGKPASISIARHDDTTGENYTKYVSYQWDGDNLTKFTDAANIQHSYAYTNGFLTQNETETIDYSAQGRVKRITQRNGAFVKYTYNDTAVNPENAENIGAVTVSDSKGVTDTLYYSDGVITSGILDNYSDKAVYDPNNISNALTEDTIANTAYAVKFDYDSASDEETSGGENSGNNALSLYDKHSDGSYTFYKYDNSERVIESLEVAKGKLNVTSDTTYANAEAVAKAKTTTTYVGDSDDVSEWIYFERNSDNVLVNSEKETYTYYENGEMNTLKSYKWSDTKWNVTLEEYYDQRGNIGIKDEYKYGEKVTVTRTKYTYDEDDKLTEQLVKVKDGTVEFVNSTLEKYVYNPQGDVTSHTVSQWLNDAWYLTYSEAYDFNAYGNNTKKTETVYTNVLKETSLVETTQTETVTDFVYDIWNQPTKTTVKEGDKEDVVTSVTYDIFGRTLSVTEDGKSTAYTYDNFDNVLTVTDEEGTTTYEYTNGNLVKRTNPNNTVANYTYDGFGNLTNHSYNGYSFTYNTLGSILTASAENEQLVSYTYSNDVEQNVLDSAFGNGQNVSYTYDDEGRMTATKFGEETKYGYAYFDEKDEDGKVTKEWTELTDYVNNLKKVFEENKTTVNDLNGNLVYSVESVSKDEDNVDGFDGVVTTIGNKVYTLQSEEDKDTFKTNDSTAFAKAYKYGKDNELESIETGSVKTSYTYNDDKLISLLTNTLKDTEKSFGYEYNKDGNITAETVSSGEATDKTVYTYDSKNQLITAENSTTKWVYSYDSRGNILSKKEYTVTVDENNEKVYTENTSDSYTYDETWKDKLTSFNGQTITYDASGNPLNYMGHNLSWTMGRQLASFDGITYTYNESGIRTSKTSNGVTTKYYLNGTNIIEQTDGTNTLYFYYDRSNEVIGFNYADNDYIYVKNQQGDITDITNSDGEVVASYAYDPWGKVISITDDETIGNLNPFRYRSYYYDSDIQMYYLQSRYYDPDICRFINCDDVNYIGTSESEVSYNPFAYCENDCINRHDPYGNITFRKGEFSDEFTSYYYGGDDYTYNPTVKPSLKNKFMSSMWKTAARAVKGRYPDGYLFYMHYVNGKGKTYLYDYEKAIKDDVSIRNSVNNIIDAFLKYIKKQKIKDGNTHEFSSVLDKKVGATPKTFNWKLAIGTHLIAVAATVKYYKSEGRCNAVIYVLAYDRYNFSSGAKFAGLIPGNWNGELVTCGLAQNYTSIGLYITSISWR